MKMTKKDMVMGFLAILPLVLAFAFFLVFIK